MDPAIFNPVDWAGSIIIVACGLGIALGIYGVYRWFNRQGNE